MVVNNEIMVVGYLDTHPLIRDYDGERYLTFFLDSDRRFICEIQDSTLTDEFLNEFLIGDHVVVLGELYSMTPKTISKVAYPYLKVKQVSKYDDIKKLVVGSDYIMNGEYIEVLDDNYINYMLKQGSKIIKISKIDPMLIDVLEVGECQM